MRIIALALACLLYFPHGRRVQVVCSSAKHEHQDTQQVRVPDALNAFAALLGSSPAAGWQVIGAGHACSHVASHPCGSRVPAVHASEGGKSVVVAGGCSQTGQLVARALTDVYRVTVLCRQQVGEMIGDDNGKLTPVDFVGVDASVTADAVVVATDEAPPAEAVSTLLKSCSEQGVPHVVLLSRLGASKGRIGLGAWKAAEEAATQAFGSKGLTIVRVGEPILGGPYYAREVDTVKWSSAKAVDGCKTLEVQSGDELQQSGFGSPRGASASAIAGVLRRGPEDQASYSVVGNFGDQATTEAELDAMLNEAGGKVSSQGGTTASLKLDLEDPKLLSLTRPIAPKAPGLADLLFGPPAVSGPYWGVIILFIYGTYLTTTPDYIQASGRDLWADLRSSFK